MVYRLICAIGACIQGALRNLHNTQMRLSIAHHEREVQRIDDESGAMRIAQLQHERTAAMLRRRLADLD